jgi:transcriptional regulator with XRE-family HTH domain
MTMAPRMTAFAPSPIHSANQAGRAEHLPAFAADPVEARRKRELANFLRVKRESLSPEALGLGHQSRRRAKGLRREEVAERAGISTSWYTWLEQARDIRVSPDTLDRLAAALYLHDQEREQLHLLAGFPPPRSVGPHATVPQSVRDLIRRFDPLPALVLCSRWDVVEWNDGAARLFGDFGAIPMRDRNFLWLLFTDSEFSGRFVESDRMCHCVMNSFRAEFHQRLGDPDWTGLIQRLERSSPDFRAQWQEYGVMRSPDWRKHIDHPELGRLVFDPVTLSVPPDADLRVMFYQPADADTEAKWRG